MKSLAHENAPVASADFVAQMRRGGDPLADAAIVELEELGDDGRRVLQVGLSDGLSALADPPPAMAAFLRELEGVPPWVDPTMLSRGEIVSQSVPPFWAAIAGGLASLSYIYSSPTIARVLVQTGELLTATRRRLVETGNWGCTCRLPGALIRGAPGYVATAKVRLLHARIRVASTRAGWDSASRGGPINQLDLVDTWLGFTLVTFRALEAIGIAIEEAEQRCLYEYWRYIGHLLGIDDRFFAGVRDHASASELSSALRERRGEPDENSRALVSALVEAQTEALAEDFPSLFSRPALRSLLHGLLRLFNGDRVAEMLGVPASDVTPYLPLIAALNAEARHWQAATEETSALARAEFTAALVDQAGSPLLGGTAVRGASGGKPGAIHRS